MRSQDPHGAPDPPPAGAGRPLLATVVVPSYNRPEALRRCLASLANQTYPHYEVVVVDDASPQRAAYKRIARAHGARLIRHEANCGQAVGRNRGVCRSRGDVLIFLDDDCEVEDEAWVARHVARHAERPNLVVQGRSTFHTPTLPARAWASVNQPGTPHVDHLETLNLSLLRADFEEIGGFDERYGELEDVEFSFRAKRHGKVLLYDPHIAVTHYYRTTVRGLLKRAYQYGLRTVPVRKGHRLPGHWLLPFSFLSGLLMLVPFAGVRALAAVLFNVRRAPDAPVYLPLIFVFCLAHTAGMVWYYRLRPDEKPETRRPHTPG